MCWAVIPDRPWVRLLLQRPVYIVDRCLHYQSKDPMGLQAHADYGLLSHRHRLRSTSSECGKVIVCVSVIDRDFLPFCRPSFLITHAQETTTSRHLNSLHQPRRAHFLCCMALTSHVGVSRVASLQPRQSVVAWQVESAVDSDSARLPPVISPKGLFPEHDPPGRG
jgi:hypothetical protein